MFRLHLSISAALAVAASGCLSAGPRDTLEALLRERGEPDFLTVFRASPGPGELPLSDLRATAEYWSGPGAGGRPRWEGALVPGDPALYAKLIERIDGGVTSITLRAHRFDAVWADDFTLVDYVAEGDEVVGWDHTSYLPPPDDAPRRVGPPVHGYFTMSWWELPVLVLDIPVYLAIGLKELAGEAVKSPLSFVAYLAGEAAVERRNPVSPVALERALGASAANWRNGFEAFLWRFRVRAAHTPFDLLRELAAAVPVVGPVFDWQSPPEDDTEPPGTTLVVLTGGVHGSAGPEPIGAWARATQALRPETIVSALPYDRGTVVDPVWSMLNLSCGPGYDLATRIVFDEGVAPRDGVEIAGFSAGLERAITASRALRRGNICVNRIVGVAGPRAGGGATRQGTALLGDEEIASRLAAHLWPFPSNVGILLVRRAGGHHLPCFPDGATRAPALGYTPMLEALLRP